MSGPDTADTRFAYARLAEIVRQELASGLWRKGDALPSEDDLARHFGVSRRTVRQALSQIERGGLIAKRQGRSTIYLGRAIRRDAQRLTDFPTAAREAGFVPSTRVLWVRQRQPCLTEAHALGISLSAPVTEICRIRLLEGRPAVRQVSVVRRELAERMPLERLGSQSLYELIRKLCGSEILPAAEHLSVSRASGEEARDLHLDEGATLLRIERVAADARGVALEYSNAVARDEFFRF